MNSKNRKFAICHHESQEYASPKPGYLIGFWGNPDSLDVFEVIEKISKQPNIH